MKTQNLVKRLNWKDALKVAGAITIGNVIGLMGRTTNSYAVEPLDNSRVENVVRRIHSDFINIARSGSPIYLIEYHLESAIGDTLNPMNGSGKLLIQFYYSRKLGHTDSLGMVIYDRTDENPNNWYSVGNNTDPDSLGYASDGFSLNNKYKPPYKDFTQEESQTKFNRIIKRVEELLEKK
jgi:hypothetical protein